MTKEELVKSLNIINDSLDSEESLNILRDNDYNVFIDHDMKLDCINNLLRFKCFDEEFELEEFEIFKKLVNMDLFSKVITVLNGLTIDEKKEIYKDIKGKPISLMLFYTSNDDDFRRQIIYDTKSKSYIKDSLICGLDSDEVKIQMIRDDSLSLKNSNISSIISSFKDDDLKVQLLREYYPKMKGTYGSRILQSIKDDNLKIQLLKEHFDDFSISSISIIIKTLKNDEKKISLITEMGLSRRLSGYDLCSIIKSFKNDELKVQSLDSDVFFLSNTDKHDIIGSINSLDLKYDTMVKNKIFDVDSALQILNQFNDSKYIVDYLNNFLIKSSDLEGKYSNSSIEDNDKIIAYLINCERSDIVDIYKGIYEKFSPYLCSKYQLDESNLKYVIDVYGYEILSYTPSENIRKFINGSKENIEKLKRLIDSRVVTMDDVNTIYNCLLQKKFSLEKNELVNIFMSFKLAFDEYDYLTIEKNINKITNQKNILNILSDDEFLNGLENCGYSLDKSSESFNLFMQKLCNDISSEKDINKNRELKDLLHIITNFYIRVAREEYIELSLNRIGQDLRLKKVPNKEKQLKLIFERIDSDKIIEKVKNLDISKIDDEEIKYLLSPYGDKIIASCIKFKKDPINYFDDNFTKEELTKKYLKMFNGLMTYCYQNKIFKGLCEEEDIMDLDVESKNNINLFHLLCNIDYDMVTDKLFSNDSIYDKLKLILNKTKICNWNDTFDGLLTEVGFENSSSLQISLINYGYQLVKDKTIEEIRDLPISEIINFANANSYTSRIYKMLFEKDNCTLLINDPPSHRSSMIKEERLDLAMDYYKQMYKREVITVPPIQEIYNVSDDKEIKVVIGDVCNPINLTHGERTGSCMRIGGIGYSLFNFCLTNENGIHIRFEDPTTGKFLSRVSGFRNGNTLFLNQLRYSRDPSYKDDDFIKCLKKVAESLIENTKNDNIPIDNVVISGDQAMLNKGEEVSFGALNIKEGLDYFYSDILKSGVVLGSSNEGKLVPIVLVNDLPKYEPISVEPKKYLDNEKATFAVNHIKVVEKLLLDEPLQDAELVPNAMFAITGQDWYIYVDEQNLVHNKVIGGISEKRSIQANSEMEHYLKPLTNLMSVDQKGVGINGN